MGNTTINTTNIHRHDRQLQTENQQLEDHYDLCIYPCTKSKENSNLILIIVTQFHSSTYSLNSLSHLLIHFLSVSLHAPTSSFFHLQSDMTSSIKCWPLNSRRWTSFHWPPLPSSLSSFLADSCHVKWVDIWVDRLVILCRCVHVWFPAHVKLHTYMFVDECRW